jgi:N-methylhydantoinase A
MPDVPGERRSRQGEFVYELSVDTGGTFTDGFVSSPGRSAQVKVDTTPHDPTVGFGECVAAAAAAMGESLTDFLAKTAMVHFSSTIATNLMVQRSGAKVGLIVTSGNEDTFYGSAQEALALRSFLTGDVVKGVAGRVDDTGLIVEPVVERELEEAVRELLEVGVQIIVVSLAGSHWNSQNERVARAILEKSYPKHYLGAIHLMLSTEVSLAPSDFGRTGLALANAYLHPSLGRALYRAEDLVRLGGLQSPLLIVNTDGSSTRVAKTRAIDTFNSGPTAGAIGAEFVADALGAVHVVTFDVGGTTTDVAYLHAGAANRTDVTDFGGLPVPHGAVDLWSFGLGGGSVIASADDKSITVGPRSSGAVPGPASFGLGGRDATPTDLWLALGYVDPGDFLGGRRTLDLDLARDALSRLAGEVGAEYEDALWLTSDAVRTTLGEHLREWAAAQGELATASSADKWLFSYGGGGGLLCVDAAEALDIANIVVFPQSSVFSAFGGGLLPIAHKYVASIEATASTSDIDASIRGLADRAQRDLRSEGVQVDEGVDIHVRIVSLDGSAKAEVGNGTLSTIADSASKLAARIGHSGSRSTLLISVVVPREHDLAVNFNADDNGHATSRTIKTKSGPVDVPIVEGLGRPLAPSQPGPCFLAAPDTTVYVPAGWSAEFDRHGYGILRKKS